MDCHNKAITPDYIKEVSMVEKPGQVMDPKTLPQKHGFFFLLLHDLLWISLKVLCPRCRCCFDLHVILKKIYFFTKNPTALYFLMSFRHLEMFYSIPTPCSSAPLFLLAHVHYLALTNMTEDALHDFFLCFVFFTVWHLHGTLYFCIFIRYNHTVITVLISYI